MTDKILEGAWVRLRPIREEDTQQILRWRNAPHVMKHFILREPLTEETHLKWLHEEVAKGLVEQFVIELKTTGQAIGSQYFQHIDRKAKSAEFGIFIGEKEAMGKGYGKEVLALSLAYAYEDMGLARVELRVLAENERALHLYTDAGFRILREKSEHVLLEGKEQTIVHMEHTR